MNLVITGLGVWTAAGRGLAPLVELLHRGGDTFTATPPYPAEGLKPPLCAIAAHLDRDRPAEALLAGAAEEALAQAGLAPSEGRVGLVAGTSTGDLSGPWERWHRATLAGEPASEEGCGRGGPTDVLVRDLGLAGPVTTLSVACASGTAAFTVAAGWLEEGLADAVLVAGLDALSLFIHAGFAGLGALSPGGARPFHPERDGLTLGEGAAVLVLEPAEAAVARGARPLAVLLGSGLASDAVHLSAPHRGGRGAAAAMAAALRDAALDPAAVDAVSVHGTGTVFNDAMEAHALREVFGARPLAIHGIKHAVGHTLGAAGAVEAAVVVDALGSGRLPPPPVVLDPALPLPEQPSPLPAPRIVLSTSSAFGGSNASVVLARPGTPAPPPRPAREVRVVARASLELPAGPVDWAALWPDPPERFMRVNRYVRSALIALHRLFEAAGGVSGSETGIVLASPSGCRAVDLRYHKRLVERGAAQASRLDFVYTVPGAAAAEAAILWDLRGPPLTFIGPMELAEEEAARLLRRGRAARLVALGIEAPEADGPAMATAALLEVAP
ncbi:MAG: beta-ketoacyl synthase N-terminal-like domain-containing protein [Pseudomonadota bacterium]